MSNKNIQKWFNSDESRSEEELEIETEIKLSIEKSKELINKKERIKFPFANDINIPEIFGKIPASIDLSSKKTAIASSKIKIKKKTAKLREIKNKVQFLKNSKKVKIIDHDEFEDRLNELKIHALRANEVIKFCKNIIITMKFLFKSEGKCFRLC